MIVIGQLPAKGLRGARIQAISEEVIMSVEAQAEFEEILIDFQNGFQLLTLLLDWARVEALRETIPTRIAAFQLAYEKLLKRQSSGTLDTTDVILSEANLATVARICEILKYGLHEDDVQRRMPEMQDLLDQCINALTSRVVPRVDFETGTIVKETQ